MGAVRYLLIGVAAFLLFLLVRRALTDVDLLDFDPLYYHLPFAARIWGITSPSEFRFLPGIEPDYQGFPLLAEFLQGLFWRVSGHMQATNLVALCALLVYCAFAKVYLRVHPALMFLALLAVPLIQIHAASSDVDLPANLACAAMLVMVYLLFAGAIAPNWRNVAVFALAAAVAANTKFLQAPVVGLAGLAVAGWLLALYRARRGEQRREAGWALLTLVVAAPLVGATYLKNLVLFGDPFYPLSAGAGVQLSTGPAFLAPNYLAHVPQSVRWLFSIFEIRAFDARRPVLWMGEQGNLPRGVPADRMGGYFFVYVIVLLALFGFLIVRSRSRAAWLAGGLFLAVSLVTSALPQSHELRYYLYWIILLISLTWYLLIRARARGRLQRFAPEYLGVLCGGILLAVVVLTNAVYLQPFTRVTFDGIVHAIGPEIREAVAKNPNLCVVDSANLLFLYVDTFHPPLHYSVQGATDADQCGSRLVLPVR
ncbi:MAG TPA: hypothetical protein VFW96_02260 [Thermomicrobiales bacterium]|nr:hypothetical protein [Thermomicrobiales bacterium]